MDDAAAVEYIMRSTERDLESVVHALISTSGNVQNAIKYLNGRLESEAQLWAYEDDAALQKCMPLSSAQRDEILNVLIAAHGRQGVLERADFLQLEYQGRTGRAVLEGVI